PSSCRRNYAKILVPTDCNCRSSEGWNTTGWCCMGSLLEGVVAASGRSCPYGMEPAALPHLKADLADQSARNQLARGASLAGIAASCGCAASHASTSRGDRVMNPRREGADLYGEHRAAFWYERPTNATRWRATRWSSGSCIKAWRTCEGRTA